MAGRREDWNVGLAEDLRDRRSLEEFLLGAIEEEFRFPSILGKLFEPWA